MDEIVGLIWSTLRTTFLARLDTHQTRDRKETGRYAFSILCGSHLGRKRLTSYGIASTLRVGARQGAGARVGVKPLAAYGH